MKIFELKSKGISKKILAGIVTGMVMTMTVGSFALKDSHTTASLIGTETPASPKTAETLSEAITESMGDFELDNTTGCSFSDSDGVLTISSGIHTISMKQGVTLPTHQRIEVKGETKITLNGVNIESNTNGPALNIDKNATFNVDILLIGENTLTSTVEYCAGLQKSNDATVNPGKLTIGGIGTLNANGGDFAAGIGSASDDETASVLNVASNIEITGGTVIANGGIAGAGIGGGKDGIATYIKITDGIVKANGVFHGSGIGAGMHDKVDISGTGRITIDGGEIEAIGGLGGAGIGGNYIRITDGKIKAIGGMGAAGIGGSAGCDGNNIEITGGVIKAIGGFGEDEGINLSGAGIGGGVELMGYGGGASGNKISGNAVVLAANGDESKAVLQGFDEASQGSITQGITFIGVGIYDPTTFELTDVNWNKNGTMYGNVTILKNIEFPANFTVTSGNQLTVAEGKTLTVNDKTILKNEGTINLNGTIRCLGSGEVTTLVNYDTQGGTTANFDEYKTYQNADGVKTYETLPDTAKNGYKFGGWYIEGTEVKATTNVLLNQHTLYANWIIAPIDGKGSSKTGDPFMGGMALALLGVATTGAVLVRKRK